MLIKQLLKLRESDNADEQLALWKDAVKKKYPELASKMKFKSQDQGKHISAEIDGEDRSYGVFDVSKGTGQVLGEAECKFKKGDVLRVKKSALAKLKKADPKATFKDDATGKVKDTPFGGTKITFSKDLNGKKMWATSDLEAVPVSEEQIDEVTQMSGQYKKNVDKMKVAAHNAAIKRVGRNGRDPQLLKRAPAGYVYGEQGELLLKESTVTEGIRYDDSSDFDADLNTVETAIKNALKIVESAQWQDWMEATDENYDVKVKDKNKRLAIALSAAKTAFDALSNELDDAN